MLQPTQSPPALDEAPRFATPSETLEYFLGFMRRQYPIVVFAVVFTISLGAIYALTTPPSYTATATMIIDTRKVQLFQQQSLFTEVPIDAPAVESQVEILKSENVALSVLKNLRLTEDPEFVSAGGGLINTLIGLVSNLFGSGEPSSQFDLTRTALSTFANRLTVRRLGLTYVINISYRSLNPDRAAEIANAIADAYIVDQL